MSSWGRKTSRAIAAIGMFRKKDKDGDDYVKSVEENGVADDSQNQIKDDEIPHISQYEDAEESTTTSTETTEELGLSSSEENDESDQLDCDGDYNAPVMMESFQNQASGHSHILSIGTDKIAKPCNPHEAKIYRALMNNPLVLPAVPRYFGIMHLDLEEEVEVRTFQMAGRFIVLENLTAGYRKPCVMDLKLGVTSWNDQHSEEQVRWRRLKATATTSAEVGFRLAGMRVYHPVTDTYIVRTSKFGRHLRRKTLLYVLKMFFSTGARVRIELLTPFIEKLTSILRILKKQKQFNFRASSLLLLYDGEADSPGMAPTVPKFDVRLIDFDHAEIKETPSHSDEHGIRVGFRSLLQLLKNLKYSITVTTSVSGLDLSSISKQKTLMRLVDDKGVSLRRVNSVPKLNEIDTWQHIVHHPGDDDEDEIGEKHVANDCGKSNQTLSRKGSKTERRTLSLPVELECEMLQQASHDRSALD